MNGPRNPDDAIEPMLEQERQRYPLPGDRDCAIERGMNPMPDEEDFGDEDGNDDHVLFDPDF